VWQIGGHYQGGILLSPDYFIPGALALLDGETDGFAIQARTDPPTVAVIDTGTPANNLSDVAFGASNLVQSGTSPKMVHWNSAPYVRWTPHNLFLNSAVPATQNVTLVVGFVYTVTVTGAGGGDITGSSGASGTATTGSPATFTATGTTGTFTLTGSLDTIQINRGPIATQYLVTTGAGRIGIPHAYDNAESQYGVQIEPAATNVGWVTEDLSAAGWNNRATSETTNTDIAPDGSLTADTMTGIGGTSQHSMYQQPFSSGNLSQTISTYVKAGTCSFPYLLLSAFSGTNYATAVFDLTNSSATTASETAVGATSGTITATRQENVGNGWFRISLTSNLTGTVVDGNRVVGQANAATGNTFTTEGEVGGVPDALTLKLWGWQVELANVASSYIPNFAAFASVTRAADSIVTTVSSFPAAGAAHSLRAKAKLIGPDTALGAAFLSLATSGDATEVSSITHDTGPVVAMFSGDSGTQALFTIGSIALGTVFNAAVRFTTNDFEGAAGGTLSGTPDTSGNFPAVHNRLDIPTGTMNFYLYEVVSIPRAYNDTELQAETA
jgi:hypothetical protein